MQLLVRDLATGLGLTGLVVSPAFGYAGVGFPLLGMNAFAQIWGAILPLRWYMAVLLGQAARGLPLSDSARPFAVLAALAVLYTLLAFLRLRALAGRTSPHRAWTRAGAGLCRAARHRRSLRRRVAARARDPRSLHPAGAGAAGLRLLLPAAVSQPDPAQDPDRGGRQRSERAEPQHRADLGCERRGQGRGSRRDARRGARGDRPRRGLRRGRHPAPDAARRAQGRHRPPSDLCRCHLPVHLQNNVEPASRLRSIRCRRSSPRAARAPTAAWPRRRWRPRAPPTSCCSRSSTRSAATRATSCRRPSC